MFLIPATNSVPHHKLLTHSANLKKKTSKVPDHVATPSSSANSASCALAQFFKFSFTSAPAWYKQGDHLKPGTT